jgi:hypothetical protein
MRNLSAAIQRRPSSRDASYLIDCRMFYLITRNRRANYVTGSDDRVPATLDKLIGGQ